MRGFFVSFSLLLNVLLCTSVLKAFETEKLKLQLNDDHSFVKFSIPYLNVSEVEGYFKKIKGEITLNKKKQITDFKVELKTDSIDTNNKLRDKHLNESEFFNSKKYPVITISYRDNAFFINVNNRIIKHRAELTGLVGQVDAWGKKSYFQRISTKIKLKEFGFKWNKLLPGGQLLLGDLIEVKGVFQWQEPKMKTASNKHRIPETKALSKIRLEGRKYRELQPTMVKRKKKQGQLSNIKEKSQASVFVKSESVNFHSQLVILLGFIGIVGFYLLTRLYLVESRFPGYLIDIIFMTYIAIYLFLGWSI